VKRALAAVLAAACCLAPVHIVRAAGPTAEERGQAKEHYERGKALQAAGSYADAIAEYQVAYALMPTPEFLFNIAQCHRLSGDKARAVEYYQRYLEAAPRGKGAPEAHAHIETLTHELELARPAPVPPAEPAPAMPAAPGPSLVDAGPSRPRPPARKPFGLWQWSGISLASGGLVSAGVASYLSVRAYKLGKEVSLHDGEQWGPELTDKYNTGQRYEKWSVGLFIGAGVLIAGGVAAYWFGPRPEPSGIRLAPSVSPGQLGFVLDAPF